MASAAQHPEMIRTTADSSKPQTNGFLVTLTAALALLAKRASRLKPKTSKLSDDDWKIELRTPPSKSPLARPKKLLSNISSKALPFVHNKKKHGEETGKEDFGDGGIWQKAILMGDKCQPLVFSGAVYYDSHGKQMSEPPLRSPRASPLPAYLTRPRDQKL